jgi:hypothetical protein
MEELKTRFSFKSIELNKKIIKTAFIDLIFYASILAIILILATWIRGKISSLTNTLDLPALFSNNIDLINQNLDSLTKILVLLILFIVISIILIIITYTFFKGLIWAKLLNKKFSWKSFRKYFYLNLIYLIPAIIIILTIFFKYENAFLTIIISLLFLHFHFLLSYYISNTNKIILSFKQAFKKGIKINKFIYPYLIISAGFLVLSFILGKISYFYFSIRPMVHLVIYILYSAVSRNYIKNIIQKRLE